jgi:predicted dehydrogenase
MLRVVVVGTGWWGVELAKAAKALPDRIAILGCTSLSADECACFCAAFGGRTYQDFDAVLADGSVDAVLLATPHSLHWQQIVRAAQAGKHVFCEKPFTLSVETAGAAMRACEQAGVVLGVGHNRRYMPGARAMKAMIDAGEIGRILHVEANYSGNIEGRYPPDHWRVRQDEVPAGATTPMGLHMVDTLTWMLGPIARLVAVTKHQALSYTLDDTCAVLFELQSGATGLFASHLACPSTSQLRIFGTQANLEARDNFAEVLVVPVDVSAPRTVHRYPLDDSLPQELGALADACAGKSAFPVRPIEALRNVAVLEAIQQSAKAKSAWVHVAQGPSR